MPKHMTVETDNRALVHSKFFFHVECNWAHITIELGNFFRLYKQLILTPVSGF